MKIFVKLNKVYNTNLNISTNRILMIRDQEYEQKRKKYLLITSINL